MRFLILFVVLAWSLPSRADVFVVAPPWFEPLASDGEQVSDRIAAVVQRELESQYKVLSPTQAANSVSPEERVPCPKGACAERYREASYAAAAIVVRVYREEDGKGPATSFQIGLQTTPGIEFSQGAMLSEGALEELVRRALGKVFWAYRQGTGPFLHVTGSPEGATIFLDDKPVGAVPQPLQLQVGTHDVRVEALGYEPQTQIVSLPSVTTSKELSFYLEPARTAKGASSPASREEQARKGASARPPDTAHEPPLTRRRTAIGLMTGGALLLAVGAPYLGVVLRKHHQVGECPENQDGCRDNNALQGSKGPQLGVGSTLVALGALSLSTGIGLFMRDKRIRLAGAVGPGHALLIMKGSL